MFKTLVVSSAVLVLFIGKAASAQAPRGADKPSDAAAAARANSTDRKEKVPAGDSKTSDGKRSAPDSGAKTPSDKTSASAGDAKTSDGKAESLLGISILGNKEAPKSLVIVPWKSSQIGKGLGVSRALDTSIRPVDKDVFARELEYYEIRANGGKK